MNKVTYNGEIYTVEEEFHEYYRLSGSLWVKKNLCKQVPKFTILAAIKNLTIEKIALIIIYSFLTFHILRIFIINI